LIWLDLLRGGCGEGKGDISEWGGGEGGRGFFWFVGRKREIRYILNQKRLSAVEGGAICVSGFPKEGEWPMSRGKERKNPTKREVEIEKEKTKESFITEIQGRGKKASVEAIGFESSPDGQRDCVDRHQKKDC